ncbi:MAG: hypothetical protein ACE5IR_17860 [bacterium]
MLKKSRFTIVCLTLLSVIFVWGNSANAKGKKINWTRMQRDLDIMEGILDEIFSSGPSGLGISSNGSRGLYFNGYGVVFQIDISNFQILALDHLAALEKAEQVVQEQVGVPAPPSPDSEVVIVRGKNRTILTKEDLSTEKQIKRLKQQCMEFFSDYSDAIGQLHPTDRVTVLIHLGQMHPLFAVRVKDRKKSEQSPSDLEVTAKKSDIIDFRKGKLTAKAFHNRIAFNERYPGKQKDRTIHIMANILNTALNYEHRSGLRSSSRNRGIYLDGLGALFLLKSQLVDVGAAYDLEITDALAREEFEKYVTSGSKVRKRRKRNTGEKVEKSLSGLKDDLIELVGDYGHTLRQLKQTEHVVITVDFRSRWRRYSKIPNQLILKVQKQDLDKYDRGTFTLAQLRKQVEFQEH